MASTPRTHGRIPGVMCESPHSVQNLTHKPHSDVLRLGSFRACEQIPYLLKMVPCLWMRSYTQVWLLRESASTMDPAWGTQGLCCLQPGSREETALPGHSRCLPFDEAVVVLEIKGQQFHIITKLLHAVQGRRKKWLRPRPLGPEPICRGYGTASLG